MSRKVSFSSKFLVIPGAISMMIYFQNCAPPREFNALSAEFSSTSSEEILKHEDPHVPIEEKAKLETTYEPLLVDRRYLRDLFLDVFGPSAATIPSGNLLFNDAVELGSLCNLYENYNIKNSKGIPAQQSAMNDCSMFSPKLSNPVLVPKPTVKRQALINRYCSDLVQTDATLTYALKKIGPNLPAPFSTQDNLIDLFHLFYRAHPEPQNSLIESLALMFSGPTADKEEWKAAILAVCTSSQWQVL